MGEAFTLASASGPGAGRRTVTGKSEELRNDGNPRQHPAKAPEPAARRAPLGQGTWPLTKERSDGLRVDLRSRSARRWPAPFRGRETARPGRWPGRERQGGISPAAKGDRLAQCRISRPQASPAQGLPRPLYERPARVAWKVDAKRPVATRPRRIAAPGTGIPVPAIGGNAPKPQGLDRACAFTRPQAARATLSSSSATAWAARPALSNSARSSLPAAAATHARKMTI